MEGEKGMEVRYYICKHCGNIVEKVKDKGVPVICCGEPMQELKAGVTDAAVEKHVPVYIQWKAVMFMSWSERQNIQCLKNISLSGLH